MKKLLVILGVITLITIISFRTEIKNWWTDPNLSYDQDSLAVNYAIKFIDTDVRKMLPEYSKFMEDMKLRIGNLSDEEKTNILFGRNESSVISDVYNSKFSYYGSTSRVSSLDDVFGYGSRVYRFDINFSRKDDIGDYSLTFRGDGAVSLLNEFKSFLIPKDCYNVISPYTVNKRIENYNIHAEIKEDVPNMLKDGVTVNKQYTCYLKVYNTYYQSTVIDAVFQLNNNLR